jgi:ATP-dependent helicase/nuclease subunit B
MTLFAALAPRVFTIAPHRPFLDDLASVLLHELADPANPFALADATVLVPNRRAARELAAAFLRASGEDPPATLLPAIRAIGDVGEDEPSFEPGELALDTTPAISPARRRFELAALVHAKARAQDKAADPAASLPLAEELGRLLDEAAAVGGADFATLGDDVLAQLPRHLQQSALFLEIVNEHWPSRLDELGRIDAAVRRERIMEALAARWIEAPPGAPVIAAGSTGSQAATRKLLAAVARLPKGIVVLPGVDVDLDARAWDEIDDGHPQLNLRATLDALGVAPRDVATWPGSEEAKRPRARRRLVNEALRPATATDDWLERLAGLDAAGEGLAGLALIEAPTPDAEARAIALAVREALETTKDGSARDVMVVTPDLSLADRIATALQRFGVVADLSAGRPLVETVPGAFLAHVLDVALDPGDPVAICALAKHPLTALGLSHRAARIRFAEVERLGLRGVRAGPDIGAILRRLESGKASENARALVEALAAAVTPLAALGDRGTTTLAELSAAHVAAAEAIAKDEGRSGAERLWREEAGEAAAALMRELIEEAEAFPPVSLDAYARLYQRLARSRAVRRRGAEAPRVRILGPLEARLQSAGLIIAAGLNEGSWPARPAEDPFMSRGMRVRAGLPPPERRLSLAAHDFAQLACAPNVILTRALRDDSGPTVASRWLWRLQTLARGAGAALDASGLAHDYTALAGALDRIAPEDARPVGPPKACPPVSARPRRLSATRVGEWVRDPYGLYARRILGLKRLDDLDKPPGPMERGNAVHAALEELVRAHPDSLPEDFAEQLAALAVERLTDQGFTHAELALQAPRTQRAALWFAEWERMRRADGWRPKLLEAKGEASFDAPGGAFTIEAKADRIDVGPDGASILDYKTGRAATAEQAKTFVEPQLGLEAAIAALGGYEGLPAEPPFELLYLRIQGGRTEGEEKRLFPEKSGSSVADIAESTLDFVKRGAARFDDPTTPYRSRVRVHKIADALDYDRLARVKEWASPGEDEA